MNIYVFPIVVIIHHIKNYKEIMEIFSHVNVKVYNVNHLNACSLQENAEYLAVYNLIKTNFN